MRISIVVITRDEAPRLALTLASLEVERRAGTEVIVVDDGSRDATRAMLDAATARMPIERVTHATARGRSAARNAGAARASGEILLFLDGDVLLGPGSIEQHIAVHTGPTCIGRGEQYHLRTAIRARGSAAASRPRGVGMSPRRIARGRRLPGLARLAAGPPA